MGQKKVSHVWSKLENGNCLLISRYLRDISSFSTLISSVIISRWNARSHETVTKYCKKPDLSGIHYLRIRRCCENLGLFCVIEGSWCRHSVDFSLSFEYWAYKRLDTIFKTIFLLPLAALMYDCCCYEKAIRKQAYRDYKKNMSCHVMITCCGKLQKAWLMSQPELARS